MDNARVNHPKKLGDEIAYYYCCSQHLQAITIRGSVLRNTGYLFLCFSIFWDRGKYITKIVIKGIDEKVRHPSGGLFVSTGLYS
jgi:hypothetical protein